MNPTTAIIGGTGFESALESQFGAPRRIDSIETQYGTAVISTFGASDFEIAFLARHGVAHSVAPHNINHRANIAGLKDFGALNILSTSAVGSLRVSMHPGDIVVPSDFIDLRGGPPTTFFGENKVVHTDFSEPMSSMLRPALLASAQTQVTACGLPASIIHPAGVYLCVNGPRYETAAEVRCFALLGADIVGMTVAPEAILARESGLEYASVSIATNFGAGLTDAPISHVDVETMMSQRRPLLTSILIDAARAAAQPR